MSESQHLYVFIHAYELRNSKNDEIASYCIIMLSVHVKLKEKAIATNLKQSMRMYTSVSLYLYTMHKVYFLTIGQRQNWILDFVVTLIFLCVFCDSSIFQGEAKRPSVAL
jgi:hypothetical protein